VSLELEPVPDDGEPVDVPWCFFLWCFFFAVVEPLVPVWSSPDELPLPDMWDESLPDPMVLPELP
jgi:hypothetical protein